MELFTPDLGLVFWMLVAFLVIFFILAKYAWPSIINGVDERSRFIDESIRSAKEANERLDGIKTEGERLIAEAREKQLVILQDASELRENMVKEAKKLAEQEGEKIREAARVAIQQEKEAALKEIRAQVAQLSIDIAEKVLRRNLDNKPAQMELIDKLLDEVKNN